MKKFILKSNAAYDKLKEPWRFLLLLLVASPTVLSPIESTAFTFISASWTFLIICWRASGNLINDLNLKR